MNSAVPATKGRGVGRALVHLEGTGRTEQRNHSYCPSDALRHKGKAITRFTAQP